MPDEKKLDYSWPPAAKRRVIGKRVTRLDAAVKTTGKVKYASDIKRPGLLQGVVLTSPHAHARLISIDIDAAAKSPGVAAVEILAKPGMEIQYAGYEVAAVAASTLELARDAARKIKVEYEALPHLVREDDLAKAGNRAKPAAEQVAGDPDQAFKEPDTVLSEGFYSLPVIDHCTMEAHGQVVEFQEGGVNYWPSTQNVSGLGGELAKALEIPATTVRTRQDAMGGGFGSKFSADRWGVYCAQLSKKTGKAVKLFLDRRTELEIAGNRPSDYANIKLAAKKDGTITAWESKSWSTGGVAGANLPPIPYVFRKIPNKRINHTAVQTNCAGQRAWRAPNHPQASYLTLCALDDLAAKLEMDPLDFFKKNADLTDRAEVYRAQLDKAAELSQWKKNWHPRGKSGAGPVKRGLGIGMGTWGGLGHDSTCRTNIHADGSVEVEIGTQDLGTGTRTVVAMVAAETLGLRINDVKVKIGDNQFPRSGASGGSTTVGGVSVSTRRSTRNALEKLFEVAAPALGAPADQLEIGEGKIQVKGNPAKSLTWKAACQKLGVKTITETGASEPKNSKGLMDQGVGGVQIADVSVDIETGIVKMNRMVAVQDCGLIINPKTAEGQVYGACIFSISGALMEERVMDQLTGRMLNGDLEFYKLSGIGDIGEIVVHLDIRPEHDQRGVIGLGEPPVVPGMGAIANAVANAIGARVPTLPLTPNRVLAALEGRKA